MTHDDCPFHKDFDTRIQRLEAEMSEVIKSQKSPTVIVAIIGLVGTVVATISATASTLLIAYCKARGWF